MTSLRKQKNIICKATAALLWLALWAAAAALVGRDLLLPGPLTVLRALAKMACEVSFWKSCAATLGRIMAGFALGLFLGCALGALSWRFPLCREFFAPILSVVKATPVASFILLALVWLRVSNVPVCTAVLIVTPVAYSNIFSGLAAFDPDLLEMAGAFHMRAPARLKYLYFPALAPYLRAAVAAGMGMAWKSGVAAEVICIPRFSLGAIMYRAKVYLETPELLAATAAMILLSMALEKIVLRLIRPKGGEGDA